MRLPRANDAELAVLATILDNPDSFWEIVQIIPSPAYFSVTRHRKLYETYQGFLKEGKQVDMVSLIETGVEKTFIMELLDTFGASAAAVQHAQEVRNAYLQRQIVYLTKQSAQRASHEDDPIEVMQELTKQFYDLQMDNSADVLKFGDVLDQGLEYYETVMEEDIPGMRTGLNELDNTTMGIEEGDYFVILGAPSSGKTALALQIALNLSSEGIRVGILPMEGSIKKLGYRMLVNQSSTHPSQGDHAKISKTLSKIHDYPIYVRRIAGLSDITYPAVVQQMKQQYDIQVVIIDFIQLMQSHGNNRNQEISNISRTIVDMNSQLDLRSIVLSQPIKGAFNGRLPQMSDVRDSGTIAQDATKIVGIAAASNLPDDHAMIDKLTPDEIEKTTVLNICKVKEGSTRVVNVHIEPQLFKFYDRDNHPSTPF